MSLFRIGYFSIGFVINIFPSLRSFHFGQRISKSYFCNNSKIIFFLIFNPRGEWQDTLATLLKLSHLITQREADNIGPPDRAEPDLHGMQVVCPPPGTLRMSDICPTPPRRACRKGGKPTSDIWYR